MKLMKNIILFIFIVIFLSCSYEYHEQNLFFPPRGYKLPSQYRNNIVHIKTRDNLQLEALYLKNKRAKVNLICFQGNGSIFAYGLPFYEALRTRVPSNVFVVNYRGYGKNRGVPTIEGILEDARSSISYFTKHQNLENKPVYLFGFSLGGFVAANSIKETDAAGLILVSTFTNAEEMLSFTRKEKLSLVMRPFVRIKIGKEVLKLDNITPVKYFKKPLLIIHGEKDATIPSCMGKKLYRVSASSEKKLVLWEGAGHNEILSMPQYREKSVSEIVEFIGRYHKN